MRLSVLVLVLSVIATPAFAALDLSKYDLTESQKALLIRLEQRGLAEQTLVEFAEKLVRENNPYKIYIPEHTPEELDAVTRWAEGGAYRSYAKDAELEFDFHGYMADCPNLALFNFGRATGTQHLRNDVLAIFTNTVYSLNYVYTKSPENFQKEYIAMISKTPFLKYLILKEGDVQNTDLLMVNF